MTKSSLFSEKLLQDWNSIMKNEPLIRSVKRIVEYNKAETSELDQEGSLGAEIDFGVLPVVKSNKLHEEIMLIKDIVSAVPGEPLPPKQYWRGAEHHWLEKFDCDGSSSGLIVLQWNPGAKRWSHSGYVGSGIYVDTKNWVYHSHCQMPD